MAGGAAQTWGLMSLDMVFLPTPRRFLCMTSVGKAWVSPQTLGAGAGVSLQALAGEGGLEFGFSLYGMKTLPIAEALRVCAEIGYRNVELALNAGFPTELATLTKEKRAALREEIAKSRLGVSGLLIN